MENLYSTSNLAFDLRCDQSTVIRGIKIGKFKCSYRSVGRVRKFYMTERDMNHNRNVKLRST